jgi:hypothetical protein
VFLAKNPQQGALIHYYFSEPEAVKVSLTYATSQGVRTIKGSNHVGLNRAIEKNQIPCIQTPTPEKITS